MTTRAARFLVGLIAAGMLAAMASARSASGQTRTVSQSANPSQPAIISAEVEDVTTHQAMYSVRGDLRELIVAQETFWQARRTYAPDVSYLPMFHPTPGVTVQILQAHPDGWTARAAFNDGLGMPHSCAIWVGEIAPAERPTTEVEHKSYPEAEVSCDGDGYTAKGEWAAAGRAYMTYALRKLMRSESRFFAFHQRFTSDTNALDPFIWDRDVRVVISAATPTGWAARASFAAFPGRSCIVWHGVLPDTAVPATAAERHRADADAVACD